MKGYIKQFKTWECLNRLTFWGQEGNKNGSDLYIVIHSALLGEFQSKTLILDASSHLLLNYGSPSISYSVLIIPRLGNEYILKEFVTIQLSFRLLFRMSKVRIHKTIVVGCYVCVWSGILYSEWSVYTKQARSKRLWRWYININIMFLDITHRPVFVLKHNVSETGFCLRLQVKPAQLGPIDRASPYLRTTTFRRLDSVSVFR
jgi:hypothetical protein